MSTYLTPAVNENTPLSAESANLISILQKTTPIRFIARVSIAWLSIFLIIFVAESFDSIWATLVALFIIAGQQNILAVLMHDQVHHNAFKSSYGNMFVNIFTAYPLLITLEGYRKVHIAHHKNFMTDKDPDYVRKAGPDWDTPIKLSRLLKLLLTDCLALNLYTVIKSKDMLEPGEKISNHRKKYFQLAFYLTILSITYFTGTLHLLLIYWVLPLATIFQAIVRLSALFEHRYNLIKPSITQATPLIKFKPWEKLIYPSLNFIEYHIYHHFYPTIPYSKLPQVHKIYLNENLVNETVAFPSLFAYLKSLVQNRRLS